MALSLLRQGSANLSPEGDFACGCLALLSCHIGYEELICEATDSLGFLSRSDPQRPMVLDASAAISVFASRISGLAGVLRLAEHSLESQEHIAACSHLRTAIVRARAHNKVLRRFRLHHDPLELHEEEVIGKSLERIEDLINISQFRTVDAAEVAGLYSLAKSHYLVRTTGRVEAGWSHVVHSVGKLEAAACTTPDSEPIVSHLHQALDLFEAIAGAILTDCDIHLLEFTRNTCDACAINLVRLSPLNRLARPGERTEELDARCAEAYKHLFSNGRVPLPGEFLVDFKSPYYVLTNLRLLLLDRNGESLVALNTVRRFSCRTAGVGSASIVFQLHSGAEMIVNNRGKRSYPDEPLVSHLLAAAMWEGLLGDQLDVLTSGQNQQPPTTGEQRRLALDPAAIAPAHPQPPAAGSVLPGVESVCSACGNTAKHGDAFCRNCGGRLAPIPPHTEVRALEQE